MLFEWVKDTYTKNKTSFFMLVVIIMYEMLNFLEKYILENIALISREPVEYINHDPGNYSCPYIPNIEEDHFMRQQTSFYWTERQKASVQIIRNYSPVLTLLFGGIYSDKYGGHRVVLVGMILCAFVMSTLYLSILSNNYVFIVMLALRRTSQGIIWVAFFSLAGKLAMSDQRTIFVSILLAGDSFGQFLGYIVSRIVVKWKMISQFSGFVGFVTAIWWWMICRNSQFPKVHRSKHIPWKNVMTSFSLYVLCLLNTSSYFFTFITANEYEIYAKQVLFFKVNPDWVIRFILCLTGILSYLYCGAASDYIISKRHLSASVVRRSFISFSVVALFCTVVVVKLAECDGIIVVGCSIALHYSESIAWSTALAAVLDFAPSCSGAVIAMVFMFGLILKFPINSMLFDTFVSGDSKGDINSWSELFFTVTFLCFVFSLPFICCGIRESSWGTEASLHSNHRNIETDSGVSKGAQVGMQQFLQDANPGPSNL